MKNLLSPDRVRALCLASVLALLAGCTSTHIQSSRHAAAAGTPLLTNIVVIGVDQSREVRAPFENNVVRCLQARGVRGTSSYPRLSLDEVNGDQQQLRQRLLAAGAQSVLIVRVTDREDFVDGPPASLGSLDANAVAESRYTAFTTPGGDINTVLFLGGRCYRLSDGAVIWSCRLQEVMKEDTDSVVFMRKTAKALVDQLAKDKVIP